MVNIPNMLTFVRIGLIPLFLALYYLPKNLVPLAYLASAMVFALAAVTDWLDGYLARKLNQTTPLGAFLDPVADKLMVATALVVLVETQATIWMAAPAIVIIGREIAISALREWMAEIGKRAHVKVSQIGKFKTTAQMIAITVLVAHPTHYWILAAGYVLLYIAVVLTLWSMFVYMRAAWPELTRKQ